MPKSIAFIDSRVTECQTIHGVLNADTRKMSLNSVQDGVLQTQMTMCGCRDLDSNHIVSLDSH